MPQHPECPDDGLPDPDFRRLAADRRLREAVRATPPRYHPDHDAAMRDVEFAVCGLVDELRVQGLGPEKVLVIVKTHVSAWAHRPPEMVDEVVRWCIGRYYGDPPGT